MGPVVIDTNIMMKIIRGNQQLIRWFKSISGYPIFPCFIIMELFAGCRSKAERTSIQREIIDIYGVYIPNDKDGVIIKAYKLVEENPNLAPRLKVADALIAASAMRLHARLYTEDNDFANVPGLKKYSPEILPLSNGSYAD
jgi:predicted nucleic acid-binding protein